MAIVDFEGLVGRNESAEVPDGYSGLDWADALAIGKNLAPSLGGGYSAVLRGKAVSSTSEGLAIFTSGDEARFDLNSGHFAAAQTDGLEVTIQASRNGTLVAEKTVVLDMEDTVIHFGHKFENIELAAIVAEGEVAFDNLKMNLPPAGPPIDRAPVFAASTLNFEGLVGANHEHDIPNGYGGVDWGAGRAIGRNIAGDFGPGFANVRHGDTIAATEKGTAYFFTAETIITLKSGHFASANVEDLEVTIQSYRGVDLIGEKTVHLSTDDTLIEFGKKFKHVDLIAISAEDDEVGFDNFVIKLDEGGQPLTPHSAHEALDLALPDHQSAGYSDFI